MNLTAHARCASDRLRNLRSRPRQRSWSCSGGAASWAVPSFLSQAAGSACHLGLKSSIRSPMPAPPAGSTHPLATKSASTSRSACSTCGITRRSAARLQSTQVRAGSGAARAVLPAPKYTALAPCSPPPLHVPLRAEPTAMRHTLICIAGRWSHTCANFCSLLPLRSVHVCAQPVGARHQQLEAHPQPRAAARVPPQLCALCRAALQLWGHVPGQVSAELHATHQMLLLLGGVPSCHQFGAMCLARQAQRAGLCYHQLLRMCRAAGLLHARLLLKRLCTRVPVGCRKSCCTQRFGWILEHTEAQARGGRVLCAVCAQ